MKILNKLLEGTILKVSESEIYLIEKALNRLINTSNKNTNTGTALIDQSNDLLKILNEAVCNGSKNTD